MDTQSIKKNTGKLSDVVTNSFYASHIINGAENWWNSLFLISKKLYEQAKLLREEDLQVSLMSPKMQVSDLILKFQVLTMMRNMWIFRNGLQFFLTF